MTTYHVGTMRIYDNIRRTAQAARHIGSRAAHIRALAKQGGPGLILKTEKGTIEFLDSHPDPDYFGDEWWKLL